MSKFTKHTQCKHATKSMRKFVEVRETCPHKFEMGNCLVASKEKCKACSFFERKQPEQQKREYARDEITKYLVAETAWHSFHKKVWAKISEGQKVKVMSKSEIITGTVKKKYDSFLLVATKNYKVCINIGELFCGDLRIVE